MNQQLKNSSSRSVSSYIEFDQLQMRFINGRFEFKFDSSKVFDQVTNGNRLLDIEQFLGVLLTLYPSEEVPDHLIDIYARISTKRMDWEDAHHQTAKPTYKMM